ncbi:MAG: BON domain-containing protein [Magnetococcales bacterium]|nr:BON domain-containing protein [Magnetococcales bacterium]
MNRPSKIYFISLTALSCLSGCIPMVVGGGVAATTSVVGEGRDLTSQMEDSWVAMKIRSRYVQSERVRVGNIGVSVYEGRVLLTGAAINQEEVNEAIRIARETRGVTEVRSEIRVQYVSPSELATDTLITSKVKSQFLVDQEVHGLNIHVKTTKGVVYLTGEAKTPQERDRAIHVARQVADVREVVSYIEMEPHAASTTTAPPPAPVTHGNSKAAPAPAAPSMTPTAPSSGTIHESISPVAAPGSSMP